MERNAILSNVLKNKDICVSKSHLSERLREIRQSYGLSQYDFAAKLNVSVGSVSGWEIGRCKPQRKKLEDISRVLKLDISYFEQY